MAINISIAVFKGHGFTASSTGNQVGQRHQQPIPPDPFRGTDLVPVKCQSVLGLAEEHLYWPPFHISVQDFTGAQGNIRADKSPQGFGGMERILWIADQYHGIIDAVKAPFLSIDIIAPIANCHEADIGICLPQMKGKLTDFLLYAAGIHDPVRLQRTDGIEALFDKSVHDIATCIPAVAEEI